MSVEVDQARDRIVYLSLELARLERTSDELMGLEDSIAYTKEKLALAARELARHTARLPATERPVGWEQPTVVDRGHGRTQ